MELWDAYNENFEKIENRTLVRGEPIPEGVFHLVCDVLVKHTDGSYLLMQRAPVKHHGGMWEATAGGSALAGEEPLQCALRELREETGIAAETLSEVGRVVQRHNRSLYVEYLCVTDWKKDGIVLQEGETSNYRWVDVEELKNMTKDELVTKRMQQFVAELWNAS